MKSSEVSTVGTRRRKMRISPVSARKTQRRPAIELLVLACWMCGCASAESSNPPADVGVGVRSDGCPAVLTVTATCSPAQVGKVCEYDTCLPNGEGRLQIMECTLTTTEGDGGGASIHLWLPSGVGWRPCPKDGGR